MYIKSFKDLMMNIRAMTFPSDDAKNYIKYLTELSLVNRWKYFSDKKLRVDMMVCPRDRRVIDAHNYSKVLLDAMQTAGMFIDDNQVVELTVVLGPIVKGGNIIVDMWEIDHAPDLHPLWLASGIVSQAQPVAMKLDLEP